MFNGSMTGFQPVRSWVRIPYHALATQRANSILHGYRRVATIQERKDIVMSKAEVNIENWSVVDNNSPYTAPEARVIRLCGFIKDERWPDGNEVSTSRILSVDGNKVETRNTIYILGEADPGFVKFCEDAGVHVPTKEVPIKTMDKWRTKN